MENNKLEQTLQNLIEVTNRLEGKIDELVISNEINKLMLKEAKTNLDKLAKECKKTRTPLFKRLFKSKK